MNIFTYVVVIGLGLFIGHTSSWLGSLLDLRRCAKSHNVYSCHWVAVPKSVKPITDSEIEGVE